jgi:FMN reductase
VCHLSDYDHQSEVVLIAGSPDYPSRSTAALERVREFLKEDGVRAHLLAVRYLPAEALLYADVDQAEISAAIRRIAAAQAVVIATPVIRGAYAGALKAFLDLLSSNALKDKAILPIATGDSSGHLLAIDYALKPVLSALGAQHILTGVYLTDAQVARQTSGTYRFEEGGEKRLRNASSELSLLIHCDDSPAQKASLMLPSRVSEFATAPAGVR